MNDDQLAKLLATADVAPRWMPPQDFAAQLRAQLRRRRNRRRVLLATPVVLAVLATAGWLTVRDTPVEQVANVPEVQHAADVETELARLLAEAEFQDRLSRRLVDDWRHERSLVVADAVNTEADTEFSAREQVEIVACRMILEAEALLAKMDPDGRATAIYEKVLRLFPETSSAQTARQRLAGRASG